MPDISLSAKLSLHYQDENSDSSQPILLLHGLGVTGESWGLQIPALVEAGFRVLAPDVRGFGRSTYPGGKTTIVQMTGDTIDLLYNLGIQRTSIAGISMGGTIALQLALEKPGLVEKLVLINTFARLRPVSLRSWIYFITRFFLVNVTGIRTQANYVVRRIFPRQDQEEFRNILLSQIMQANPQGYRAAMRALASFNVVSRLPEIQIPTLVVTAENDTTVPPRTQYALVEGIPDARQAIISSAGHAVIADQPDRFNQVLIDFLTCS